MHPDVSLASDLLAGAWTDAFDQALIYCANSASLIPVEVKASAAGFGSFFMKKRDVFAELVEGFDALKSEREGKLTLRQIKVPHNPVPTLAPEELVEVREKLRLSRPVFARYLRTNPRTLENWEQGRAKPNAQAVLLIRMVSEFPDTIKRLESV